MAFSDLNSLFLSGNYALPYLEADNSKSFLQLFSDRMEAYLTDLDSCPAIAFDSIGKDILMHEVRSLVNTLNTAMKLYLDGYPAKAFKTFKAIAEKDMLFEDLSYFRIHVLTDDTPLFRIRKEHGKKLAKLGTNGFLNAVQPRAMFHVPFERRKTIGTNRYSIPGFPSIYASDHLQTSWSECISKINEPFHAVCYRNHRPMYFLDLIPLNVIMQQNGGKIPNGLFESNSDAEVLANYALVYPIICACHSKIDYIAAYPGEIQFKSEYIIPQLLMQWYREKRLMIDGVRYLSCTAESKFPGITFNKHNFVIPVDECFESGLCPALVANFSATPVYSYLSKTKLKLNNLLGEIQNSLELSSISPL